MSVIFCNANGSNDNLYIKYNKFSFSQHSSNTLKSVNTNIIVSQREIVNFPVELWPIQHPRVILCWVRSEWPKVPTWAW